MSGLVRMIGRVRCKRQSLKSGKRALMVLRRCAKMPLEGPHLMIYNIVLILLGLVLFGVLAVILETLGLKNHPYVASIGCSKTSAPARSGTTPPLFHSRSIRHFSPRSSRSRCLRNTASGLGEFTNRNWCLLGRVGELVGTAIVLITHEHGEHLPRVFVADRLAGFHERTPLG
jgi:hypothetical protein